MVTWELYALFPWSVCVCVCVCVCVYKRNYFFIKVLKKEEEESKYFYDILLINWQISYAVLNLTPLWDVITI